MNRLELALVRDDIATLRPVAMSDARRLLDILAPTAWPGGNTRTLSGTTARDRV